MIGAARRGLDPLLLALHADGRIANDAALDRFERLLPGATDCFVFCHGWLCDEAEARVDAARFFALLDLALGPLGDRVVPLRVAIHWPSRPFGDPVLTRLPRGGGLWPRLESRVGPGAETPSRGDVTLAERQPELVALLADLARAEIPLAPEEELELDGLLGALRDARGGPVASLFQALSFWVMKQRAGQVGERLGREYLAPLVERTGRPRLHLVGHSFGAKLLTSTVLGGLRPRSLSLLQAAFSAFAFAAEIPGARGRGYYHRVLAEEQMRGPIVVLRSIHDRALSVLYRTGAGTAEIDHRRSGCARRRRACGRRGLIPATVARSALGAVGALGVGAAGVELVEATRIGLPRHRVVNVDGSRIVRAEQPVIGAHRDIHHPEVATLVLLAAGLLEGCGDGVRAPRLTALEAR